MMPKEIAEATDDNLKAVESQRLSAAALLQGVAIALHGGKHEVKVCPGSGP